MKRYTGIVWRDSSMKFSRTIILAVFTFFIVLGFTIAVQGVFGISIDTNLDFIGPLRRITGVANPVSPQDVATKNYFQNTFQPRITPACPAGKVMQSIDPATGVPVCVDA